MFSGLCNFRISQLIQKAQEFHNQHPTIDNEVVNNLMKPEVAIIVDERLQFWDKSFGALTNRIIENRYALGKTGIPYDLYLRTDLDKIPTGRYKVIWLMGIMEMNSDEIEKKDSLVRAETLVMHTDDTGTAVYSNEYKLKRTFFENVRWSANELGEMWEQSGVHRYGDSGDVVYAGRGWIGIHSIAGGRKTLKLPFYADVIDPVNGDTIANTVENVIINIKPGSTVLYRVIPKN